MYMLLICRFILALSRLQSTEDGRMLYPKTLALNISCMHDVFWHILIFLVKSLVKYINLSGLYE